MPFSNERWVLMPFVFCIYTLSLCYDDLIIWGLILSIMGYHSLGSIIFNPYNDELWFYVPLLLLLLLFLLSNSALWGCFPILFFGFWIIKNKF